MTYGLPGQELYVAGLRRLGRLIEMHLPEDIRLVFWSIFSPLKDTLGVVLYLVESIYTVFKMAQTRVLAGFAWLTAPPSSARLQNLGRKFLLRRRSHFGAGEFLLLFFFCPSSAWPTLPPSWTPWFLIAIMVWYDTTAWKEQAFLRPANVDFSPWNDLLIAANHPSIREASVHTLEVLSKSS